ncbi:MAG: xylose isomerase, partial [Bacteroidota bacterium]
MQRRSFLKSSAIASGALLSGSMAHASAGSAQKAPAEKHNFKLKYAPHFGMFRQSAGTDLLDQLQFMADAGFSALEDNGMKGREVSMQEKIAGKMASLGMEMGVFVAHTIYWNEPNLTSGNQEKLDEFLKEIKES